MGKIFKLERYRLLNIRQKIISIIFSACIFSWFLAPFSAYYVSNMEVYLSILSFAMLLLIGKGMINKYYMGISIKYSLSCLFIIAIPVFIYGDLPFVSIVAKLLFAFGFISLTSNMKWSIYELFGNFLIIILFFGIIEFSLSFLGIYYFWTTVYRDTTLFYQGFFCLIPGSFFNGGYRFESLCEEPGLLGTVCFFFLITLDVKKHKFHYIIFLVAGILSFSLGFYVIMGMWLISKVRSFSFIGLIIAVASFLIVFQFFGSIFEERIVQRVTEKDSLSAVDNRTNDVVDSKFAEIYEDGRIYYGLGNRSFYEWQAKTGGVSAGAKNFILQYGLIGLVILVISFSFLILKVRGVKKETFLILAFVWISFYKSNMWNNPNVLLPLLCIQLPLATKLYRKKSCS